MGIREPNRSVLIFGGAGFIGANLAHHLLQETSSNVHLFDNLSRKGVQHNLQHLRRVCASSRRLRVTIADIRDVSAVENAVRDATEIYQFAAQVAVTSSISDPQADFGTNCIGTFNILEAARKAGNQPFLLFTSTNKVYGQMADEPLEALPKRYAYANRKGVSEAQPLDFHSPYGCSKGAADQYVREYARMYCLPTTVFRMSCIAGEMQHGNENQGWVAHFLYRALQELPLTIYGDGRQVRDVLHVGDLVRAMECARSALPFTSGEIYNIGGGAENTTSLIELIEEIEQLTGRRLEWTNDRTRPGDQAIYVTDYTKFMHHTGWKPRVKVRETLAAIFQYWKENPAILQGQSIPIHLETAASAQPSLLQRTA